MSYFDLVGISVNYFDLVCCDLNNFFVKIKIFWYYFDIFGDDIVR